MSRVLGSGRRNMMTRLAGSAVLAVGFLSGPWAGDAIGAQHSQSPASWDAVEQRAVLRAGLMRDVGSRFQGAAPLSAGEAKAAMSALAARVGGIQSAGSTAAASASHAGGSPVTVTRFDAMLDEALGLRAVAAQVQAGASVARLRPPSYFGTEVLARFLGLRYEHPVGSQRLDLFPSNPITRAEAAWSLARALRLGARDLDYAREALGSFALPVMTVNQRQALQIAVSRIGYPYVWGGTTDNTADGLEHGGFDCSGFVWRVFKLSGLPWGAQIQGRTAAEQAGEIPRSQRLRMPQLRPGDLLFFGSAHFNSEATERNIIHEGIYLGANWVIHSSEQGVYVLPLRGSWLGSSFAWGRRVIR
jgi:hypothetical protein